MLKHQELSAAIGQIGPVTRRMLLILLITLASVPMLAGQDLRIGRRVRVTLADSSSYVGRADSAHEGQMWLATTPGAVDLGQAIRVEVSTGRKPNWLLGATLGAVAGLAVGAIVQSIVNQNALSDEQLPTGLYLGSGAAAGLLIGSGLSIVLAGERWEPVSPERWAVPGAGRNLHARRGWLLGLSIAH